MASRPAIGIFFTDSLVEVSQVSADTTKLIKFNQLPIPTGLVESGEIKDAGRLSQVIIKLLNTTRPSAIPAGSDVVIGVSDNRVFLREFTLPKLSGRDVDEAIDWQVKQLLPVLPGEVETDRLIIGKDVSGQVEVLLAAVPRGIVKSYLDLFKGIGLNLVSIEPAVFAILRIIRQDQLKGKNQLLIFLGEGFTEFIYVTNGNPRVSDFLTDADVESKGGLLASVRDYINFANSKHPERKVQELVVSGFNPNMNEMVRRLGEFKLPVVMAVSRLGSTDIKDHNLLHTSHGLSLKTASNEPSVNLLPVDYRLEEVRGRMSGTWKILLSVMSAISFVGLAALIFLWQSSISRRSELFTLRQQYLSELTSSASGEVIKRTEGINQTTDRLILLKQATGGEDGLLRELQSVTPQGITLTSFIYTRGLGGARLIDKGSSWIITGNANSRQLVLNFYDALLELGSFSTGRLYFGSLEKETGITFRIASQVAK